MTRYAYLKARKKGSTEMSGPFLVPKILAHSPPREARETIGSYAAAFSSKKGQRQGAPGSCLLPQIKHLIAEILCVIALLCSFSLTTAFEPHLPHVRVILVRSDAAMMLPPELLCPHKIAIAVPGQQDPETAQNGTVRVQRHSRKYKNVEM